MWNNYNWYVLCTDTRFLTSQTLFTRWWIWWDGWCRGQTDGLPSLARCICVHDLQSYTSSTATYHRLIYRVWNKSWKIKRKQQHCAMPSTGDGFQQSLMIFNDSLTKTTIKLRCTLYIAQDIRMTVKLYIFHSN